jgi:hypothetical protein
MENQNILRQTLQSIPDLLAQAEVDDSPLTRDLAEKLEYLREELLAEVEELTPEAKKWDSAAQVSLGNLADLVVEIVKTGKTRVAVVAFRSEQDETFVMFARRTDGRAKQISLIDFLVACAAGKITQEVRDLFDNWQLNEAIARIVKDYKSLYRFSLEPVCEVSLDLI